MISKSNYSLHAPLSAYMRFC